MTVALLSAYAVCAYAMFLIAAHETKRDTPIIIAVCSALLWLLLGPVIMASMYILTYYVSYDQHKEHHPP